MRAIVRREEALSCDTDVRFAHSLIVRSASLKTNTSGTNRKISSVTRDPAKLRDLARSYFMFSV